MVIVQKYLVDIYGGTPSDGVRARIDLIGDAGLAGTIRFFADGSSLPDDTFEAGQGVQMHVPMDAFGGTLALLQHDRPVQIDLFNDRGRLFTSEPERVGESETG